MKGYLRVASVFPNIKVGNVDFNVQNIIDEINKLANYNTKLAVFSELSITGVSLGDLFLDDDILDKSLQGLFSIIEASKNFDMLMCIGLPFRYKNCIYDVTAVIKTGNILGMVPRTCFENNPVLSTKQFSTELIKDDLIVIKDKFRKVEYQFPFSDNLVFSCGNYDGLTFSIDYDLKNKNDSMIVMHPNSQYESAFLYNISLQYKVFSEINNCALITASPSYTDSSTNYIFNSKAYIYECGDLMSKNHTLNSSSIVIDIDIDKIFAVKTNKKVDSDNQKRYISFNFNDFEFFNTEQEVYRFYKKMPYINKDLDAYEFAMHIIDMLTIALLNRLKNINAEYMVLGLSGGLDSTFALLVCKNVLLKDESKNLKLKTVFMPGFGTSNNSINNVKQLAMSLGADLIHIDISESVRKHLNDIDHDINNHNNTYENAQARERTQVLMDIANDLNGIVVGTSDLSEIALGFSTYNGDHMSMYNINGSVPKTMIRYILNAIASKNLEPNKNNMLANVLNSILESPISPELLPTVNDMVIQKTEDILGDYILHDFYIYNYLKYHYDIDKLYDLTLRTFIYDDENSNYTEQDIKNSLNTFFDRFFKSQYKRNCAPDSPSIGLVNLDSHTGFNTVSDLNIVKRV